MLMYLHIRLASQSSQYQRTGTATVNIGADSRLMLRKQCVVRVVVGQIYLPPDRSTPKRVFWNVISLSQVERNDIPDYKASEEQICKAHSRRCDSLKTLRNKTSNVV